MLRTAFILVLLWSGLVYGADCDMLASADYARNQASAMLLCDTKTGTGACGSCDTGAFVPYRTVNVNVEGGGTCTAYVLTIEHRATATGTWTVAASLDNANLTGFNPGRPFARYVRGNISTATSCTDLDVVMELIR